MHFHFSTFNVHGQLHHAPAHFRRVARGVGADEVHDLTRLPLRRWPGPARWVRRRIRRRRALRRAARRSAPRWAAWPRRGSSGAGSPRCRAAGIPGFVVRAWISRAARPEFMAAAWWPTEAGSRARAASVDSSKSGTATTGMTEAATVAHVLLYWSLSCHDSASPPKMAGATLSGWPSISLVSCRIQSRPRRAASGTRALAAVTAATTAEAEEPRPRPCGLTLSAVIRRPSCRKPRRCRASVDGPDHEVARIAGQGLRTLAAELEFKFTAGQGFHGQGVVQREGQAEAVVPGAQVGAGGRDPDGDQLARRNGRRAGS